MVKIDLRDLEGLDDEEALEFLRAKLGPAQEVDLPQTWQDVISLECYANGLDYTVEHLQAGIALGRGWKALPEKYYTDVVARARAYERARDSGQLTRVTVQVGRKTVPTCIFYKEDNKIYIAVPLEDGRALRQEVRFSLDISGGGEIEETCQDLFGNAGLP